MMRTVVLGHQGGWDELLLFAIPVAIALGAVKFVEVRARRAGQSDDDVDPASDESN